jgi:hypothetical protein
VLWPPGNGEVPRGEETARRWQTGVMGAGKQKRRERMEFHFG